MDLSKENKNSWVYVMNLQPNKMDGFIPYDVFVRDAFCAKLEKTEKGWVKTVTNRPIENRKYLEFDNVKVTKEQLNKILISDLTVC